ncbi:MAG: LLM class flavin-dependent oxidoreductase [Chloroflexi bacterium]|nr:MAG: LLM class flavin-dependent oxidoreductase [Chloroflexota bacterium]
MSEPFALYSVVPGIRDRHLHLAGSYRDSVVAAAVLAEQHGFTGTLLHYNFHALDPWMLAQSVIQATSRLTPLVATQPAAIPPQTLARFVIAIAHLYGRRVDVNLVIGARPDEMRAIGDELDHDARYHRAREYVQAVRALLTSSDAVSWQGSYYGFRDLLLEPHLPSGMLPRYFIAGSSPAGIETACLVGDVAVTHPGPWTEFETEFINPIRSRSRQAELAVRVGIIARPTKDEAWVVARERFPTTRSGQLQTVIKTRAESHWVRSLAQHALQQETYDEVLWLGAYGAGQAYEHTRRVFSGLVRAQGTVR